MHYLADTEFKTRLQGAEPKPIGEFLARLASEYQPLPNVNLKTGEIRRLNKAIDVLEADPKDGLYVFEDEDFKTLQQVAVGMASNSNIARSAPDLEDLFKTAVTEKPEPEADDPAIDDPGPLRVVGD